MYKIFARLQASANNARCNLEQEYKENKGGRRSSITLPTKMTFCGGARRKCKKGFDLSHAFT
jgi:hypothetical protein